VLAAADRARLTAALEQVLDKLPRLERSGT
jgi:hypothetical protein